MYPFYFYSTNIISTPNKHWSKMYGLVMYSSVTLLDLRIFICKMGIILSYHSGLPRIKEDHACESVLLC